VSLYDYDVVGLEKRISCLERELYEFQNDSMQKYDEIVGRLSIKTDTETVVCLQAKINYLENEILILRKLIKEYLPYIPEEIPLGELLI